MAIPAPKPSKPPRRSWRPSKYRHTNGLWVVAGGALPALADDGSVELSAGGLIFAHNENLEYKDKYCFSYEFIAAVERARKPSNGRFGAPFSEQRIEYAHKTWI